ncbi:mitochondrial protein import protein MAS5-like [Ischnura elegans]|uniref:mitochondrial protein import protein MAS5-like n=1 Tax=Ischnura elegans TaxID=197161 RepID=UPI001ED8AA90|nr:mitochondrial protein import protein MAS5-like [Ischnura elegans]
MGQCMCRKRKRQGDCQDAYRPGGSEEASRDDVPPSAEVAERLSTVDEAREIPPPPNPPMEGEGDEEIVPGWLFERHHIGAGDAGPVVGQDPPRHIPRAFQGVEGIGYLNFHLRITAEEVEGQTMTSRSSPPQTWRQEQPKARTPGHLLAPTLEIASMQVVRERKILEVHVDKGMPYVQKVVFTGEGDQEPGLEPGDIVIVLDEKEHDVFKY